MPSFASPWSIVCRNSRTNEPSLASHGRYLQEGVGRLAQPYSLEEALNHKKHELEVLRADSKPLDIPRTKRDMELLSQQIREIQRYLKDGGELKLPKCYKAKQICLLGLTQVRSCLPESGRCAWAFRS